MSINWSSSYINTEWVKKARVYRVTHEEGAELLGRESRKGKESYAGIAIPYVVPGNEDAKSFHCRLRLDSPGFEIEADGSHKELRKYLQPYRSFNSAYFPPETKAEWFIDAEIPVILVEGEKKAIALRRYFFEQAQSVLVIGIPGVWNFTNKETLRDSLGHTWAYVKAVLPEIEKIEWAARSVKILFDANAMSNPSVRAARRELASKLTARGANVRLVDLLPEPGINGLDDYLGKHGAAAFEKFLAENPGIPARMGVEDAKEVAASLTLEAIKKNPKITGAERTLMALATIKTEAPEEWFGAQATLRKVGQLAEVNKQIKARTSVKIAEHQSRLLRLVGADESKEVQKPVIDTGGNIDLSPITKRAWEIIRAHNKGPHLFVRSGVAVRLEKDIEGRPVLVELTPDRLRYELAEAADWWENQDSISPPMDVVKNMLAMPEPPLPCLRRITSVPIFANDWRLIQTPGFDAESGIFFLPAKGYEMEPLPEVVEETELEYARRIFLKELLVDFPFATLADRDNAIALCVLGAVREMIGGSTPNHAIEASIRSAGKGKLARACAGIFAGEELASVPPLETEKEWKDMITSELLSGAPAVLIDNIERPLRSAALAVAWTEPFWKDRLFHKQVMARLPINCVWITTANNMLMHEDLMTRSIRIRLEPATSRPENRTGFHHEDINLWASQNRGALVWAVHVLVMWWLQQGKPLPAGLQSTRHAEWCRVLGGIMHAAGFMEFLKNQGDFQRTAAQGVDAAGSFCLLWWNWAHEKEVSEKDQLRRLTRANTAELVRWAREVDGFPLTDLEGGQAKSLGLWLNNVRDRQIEAQEETEIEGEFVTRTFKIYRHPVQVKGKIPWRLDELK